MKKWLLIISATVICVAAAFLYFFSLTPKGDTITSRESILNQQEMEITNLVHQQTEIVMRLLLVALQ